MLACGSPGSGTGAFATRSACTETKKTQPRPRDTSSTYMWNARHVVHPPPHQRGKRHKKKYSSRGGAPADKQRFWTTFSCPCTCPPGSRWCYLDARLIVRPWKVT